MVRTTSWRAYRSVRKSDELDLPLAERWRVAGKIKERPALPAQSQLEIDDYGTQLRVRFMALAFSGRSRLTFTDRQVSFRQGQAPMERSIPLQSIEEMIHGWDATYLVGDSASLAIEWPESDADQDFLEAFVAYEIARRYPRSGP